MYGTQASNHQVKVHPDYTVPEPYTAGNLISHLWTSLLFVFLRNYLTLLTWTLSINVDNILMLNCLVLSGLIVSEGSRKRSPNVTILFAKFQSQFDSLYYLLVKFLYCLIFLFFSCLFAISYGEQRCIQKPLPIVLLHPKNSQSHNCTSEILGMLGKFYPL